MQNAQNMFYKLLNYFKKKCSNDLGVKRDGYILNIVRSKLKTGETTGLAMRTAVQTQVITQGWNDNVLLKGALRCLSVVVIGLQRNEKITVRGNKKPRLYNT